MYHYVRDLAATRFPRLTALPLATFRAQLDYIAREHAPVSMDDVVRAADGVATLPPNAILLTFDDGYAEHAREVCQLLADRGIRGAFFPAASSLVDRRVLDVNRIQFVLAAAESADAIAGAIDRAVAAESGRADVRPVEAYHADGWKAVRYDAPAAAYVKYMLQRALPADVRARVLDDLFREFVTSDERAFADELYFTADEGRRMAAAGMTIGAHADAHVALTSLSRDGQAREIDGALRALDAAGVERRPFAYSYAKGEYNDDTLALLRARGCAAAVTTRVDRASVSAETRLTLPRIDAVHLPTA